MRTDPVLKVVVPLLLLFILSTTPLFPLCAASSEDVAAAVPSTGVIRAQPDRPAGGDEKLELDETYGRQPLHFVENRGQMDKKVRFYEKGPGHSTFFTSAGVLFVFSGWHEKPTADLGDRPEGFPRMTERDSRSEAMKSPGPSAIVELTPVGMSRSVEIAAEDVQQGRVNHFIGKDPWRWHTNVPTYGSVTYRDAYAGVDLEFHGTNRQLEYDLILKPGADPSKVRFQLTGLECLEVTKDGDLSIKLKDGVVLTQKKPFVYQVVEGPKRHIAANGIAVDQSGNAYVTGETNSLHFLLWNPVQPKVAGTGREDDAFIMRFGATGEPVYSSYLGGGGTDGGTAISLGPNGNAYIAGNTSSSDFPRTNPLQKQLAGASDVFIAQLQVPGPAKLTLTQPDGGEIWNPGSTQTIKWKSTGLNRNVKIQISRDGGSTWSTLFNNLPKNGSVDWKVEGPPTSRARIRVRSVTTPGIQNASDNDLTIAGIQVVAPNGGEVWGFGTRQTVRWNSFGFSGNVRIALSRDGGKTWTTLLNSTENDGNQAWIMTGPATTQALTRVKSMDYSATVFGRSKSVFTIQ